MNGFHELISEQTIGAALLILAAVGIVTGAVVGTVPRKGKRSPILGAIVALAGPLILGLWHLFTALQDRLGFESLATVLVGVALFAGIGIALGAILARAVRVRN